MVTTGLSVRELTVRHGEVIALDGVSLDVAPGEVVCVLGPSGCGKSTLLGAVTGLVPVLSGSVSWDGEDLGGVAVHRRRFGLMFQEHALFPHLTVAGNVAFGLRMAGMAASQRERRVAELLELVGLEGLGARGVDELSGGEQQRVALARALAPDPRLVLLDEPLGALDRSLRDRLLPELRALFSTLGTTVLYVTHDREEALLMGDRLAVMDVGRIAQVGTPSEVWQRPADTFVARFLATGVVLEATVIDGWARTAVVDLPTEFQDGTRVALVVPEAAVALTDDGQVTGVVVGQRFTGDHMVWEVDISSTIVRVSTGPLVQLGVGAPVAVTVDPTLVSMVTLPS